MQVSILLSYTLRNGHLQSPDHQPELCNFLEVFFFNYNFFSFCFHFQNVFFLRKYVALFTKHSGFFIQLKGILFAHIYDLVWSMVGSVECVEISLLWPWLVRTKTNRQGNACFPSKTSGSQKETQVTGHK